MAALDFPGPPLTNGQVFTGGNGVQYVWNGTIWLASSMASQASDTPPANPQTNQLWFNSTLGQLFIYYTDANSSQWVPANPTPSGVPVGGGIIREVTLSSPAATIDLFSLGVKSVEVIYDIKLASQGGVSLRYAKSSTIISSTTYYHHRLFGGGTTASYAVSGPGASYSLAINSPGIINGRLTFPSLSLGTGTGHTWQNTVAGSEVVVCGFQTTEPTGFDGLYFESSPAMAAGSFVRVIGWP